MHIDRLAKLYMIFVNKMANVQEKWLKIQNIVGNFKKVSRKIMNNFSIHFL